MSRLDKLLGDGSEILFITNEMGKISKKVREKNGIFVRDMEVRPEQNHQYTPHIHIDIDDKSVSVKIKEYGEQDLEVYAGDINIIDRKNKIAIRNYINKEKEELEATFYAVKWGSTNTEKKDESITIRSSGNFFNYKSAEVQEQLLDNHQQHLKVDGYLVAQNSICIDPDYFRDTRMLFIVKSADDYRNITVLRVIGKKIYVLLNDLNIPYEWFKRNEKEIQRIGELSYQSILPLQALFDKTWKRVGKL